MSGFAGFGAATNTGGGTNLFGASSTPASGNMFGSTAQKQPLAQQPSIFGAPAPSTQPAQTSLFGGSQTQTQQQQGGGLFGAAQKPATGGLFGSTANSQQQQPAATGSLFGNTSTIAGSTNIFGASKPATTQGGLSSGGSMFGTQSTNAPAGGGLFGSTNTATTTGGGMFGQQNTTTGFGAQPAATQTAHSDPIVNEITKLRTVYDESDFNPNYRFKFAFYSALKDEILSNLGPNDIVQDKLTEDVNWDDETRQTWAEAKENNPDKRRFIPEIVRGVQMEGRPQEGLTGRISNQKKKVIELIQYLDIIDADVTRCHDEHVAMRERIQECKRTQIALAQSCLEAVSLIESQRGRERAMTHNEEQMLVRLEQMKRELNAPQQYSARLLEMQSQARSMKQWVRQNATPVDIDEEESEAVKKYLVDQQKALEMLSNIVTEDAMDLRLIIQELNKYS